ncbi:hypothetical protein ACFLVG_02575 [Chloroflexota bacterium]
MPGKSRHGRGKYSLQSKKKKGRPSHPAALAQQPAVTQIHKPISSPNASVPLASVPDLMSEPTVSRYRYVAKELRAIGILAVVMLVILVVLALVLS